MRCWGIDYKGIVGFEMKTQTVLNDEEGHGNWTEERVVVIAVKWDNLAIVPILLLIPLNGDSTEKG